MLNAISVYDPSAICTA